MGWLDMDSVLRSISDDFTLISDGVNDVIKDVRSRNFKAFLNAHDHEKRLQVTLSHASFCQTRVEAHLHHVNLMDAFGLLGEELRGIRNVLSVNGMHSLNVVGGAAQLLHPISQLHSVPFHGTPGILAPTHVSVPGSSSFGGRLNSGAVPYVLPNATPSISTVSQMSYILPPAPPQTAPLPPSVSQVHDLQYAQQQTHNSSALAPVGIQPATKHLGASLEFSSNFSVATSIERHGDLTATMKT